MLNWVISISTVTIITSILITILPENENLGIVKFIMSLLIVIVAIEPLFNIDQKIDVNFSDNSNIAVSSQDKFLDYYLEKKLEYIKEYCNIICNEEGLNPTEIVIDYEDDNLNLTIKKINVFIEKKEEISNDKFLSIKNRIKTKIIYLYDTEVSVV